MPEEALDMALDDLVQGDRSSGKGRGNKGGGKGKTWKLWGKGSSNDGGGRGKGSKGKGKRSWNDKKEDGEGKKDKSVDKDTALDMSLEEVIESDKGRGKGRQDSEGKGKGRGKGKGKGKREWNDGGNSWGDGYSKGNGYEKGYNSDRKGSKGSKKGGEGRGAEPDPRGAAWNQHDDRADESDDDNGRGKGSGKGKGNGSSKGGGGPRGWSDRDDGRRDAGVWQRVEQPRAPLRDSRRAREPVRGRGERRALSPVPEPRSAPQKRRATEEPEGGRSVKSIKVTNIPRDVNVNDIRDAFESETGKIVRCRLDHGTAWIAFQTSGAARKAVETFDRGELNGQNIGVTLDR